MLFRSNYLIFECLAERTIALAQQCRLNDPAKGYDPLLEDRMVAVLPGCRRNGVRIITNMGAANPAAAAAKVRAVAARIGWPDIKVGYITGDEVLKLAATSRGRVLETETPVARLAGLVSAHAYLGAEPLVVALAGGADVVITGRTADPSLFLAPLIHEFGWALDDWNRLGQGTVVGHLLECAGQVTGGYFADPGHKDVPGLARLGFPIAEVSANGRAVITKVPGSGGAVTVRNCREQLLYEIHNPACYLTPDVTADFTRVRITEVAPDRVAVTGGTGRRRPDTLKVSLGYRDGFIGEGQISYAGPGALARARLATEIVRERLKLTGLQPAELRCDLVGVNAIFPAVHVRRKHEPAEVRVRIAGRTPTLADAVRLGNEVETLYTNGPAGGGGVTKSAREVIAIASTLIPRDAVRTGFVSTS